MKKRAKKLTLSKETLRNLDAARLRKAAGGTDTGQCTVTCYQVDTCGSCQGTLCDTCFSRLPNCTQACVTHTC